MNDLLTTADVATLLQVSPQRVRSLARDEVLPAVRDEGGAGWLFRATDVRDYQERRTVRRGPRSQHEGGRPAAVPAREEMTSTPRPDPARLRADTEALRTENEALRTENEALRAEVARLRTEHEDLATRLQRSLALSEVLVRELG
ncbi:DNA binding domain-containing protein, excisionase family [Raineyella antarctica]|uniref:DNA binding domain-containing protein, excisionase family n=1 Tax=Raineyella antarctica TaxID=1577474 RepID=A0A1G6GP07_9ACTN|nr:helix-turn-helix domain-containing protein [Raineyella antarctica]SDB83593.1 DNA binding domain-containing protein, excisionase family [Raineyella antarctica]